MASCTCSIRFRVGHDHPLGRVAGLAAILHPGGSSGLGHAGHVVGVQHDERVRTAELEHDLLQVLAGDRRDGRSGPLAAGNRDAAHSRVGDHVCHLLICGEHVDVSVVREPGIPEDLLHRQR
jgi:hypothetical protein